MENLRDSNGEENINIEQLRLNESKRFNIFHEMKLKDQNNLLIFNQIQDIKTMKLNKTDKKIPINIDEDCEDKNKNYTIESILQNINTSNVFKNISEISRKDINFIERGINNKIFDTENTPMNSDFFSKNDINNENIRDRKINTGRIEKNNYNHIGFPRNIKEINKKINDDLNSKLIINL
jgi:hypothetical protein